MKIDLLLNDSKIKCNDLTGGGKKCLNLKIFIYLNLYCEMSDVGVLLGLKLWLT